MAEKMSKRKMIRALGLAVIAIALAGLPAVSQQGKVSQQRDAAMIEPPKGKSFPKPEDAAAALYAAAHRNDENELLIILGPDAKQIVEFTDDADERREQRERFAQKYQQMHRLVREPDDTVALYVGAENWPLPIPLVEYKGAWYFDAGLGEQEIQYRRIGRNEMEALQVCQALVDAEKEYHAIAHSFTAKFISSDGAHDGLYWKSAGNSAKSPIGPYLAHAAAGESGNANVQPFDGYFYRILLQGTDGFAVVAFPAEYRSSGVMTFFIQQDGTAYEKDLGAQTAALSKQIASSPPDSTWKQVE